MPKFVYRALDASGQAVGGQLEAPSASQAARDLLRQGLRPLEVTALDDTRESPVSHTASWVRRRLSAADRVVLLQELATLLGAGVALDEALASVASGHSSGPAGAGLATALRAIRAGQAFHDAIAQAELGLSAATLTLVRAGEASGQLAAALTDAAEQLELTRRSVAELRGALIYPSVLAVAGVTAVLIIFVGVIPRFAPMIKGTRSEIPEFSRRVIEAALFMQANLTVLGLGAAAAAALTVSLLARAAVRQRLLEWLASLPVLGPWLRDAEVGRWASLMGTLLRNRVPLLQALRLSAQAVQLSGFRSLVVSAARELEHGRSLHESLRHAAWIPVARLNLIKVGERSGTLDAMLTSLGAMQTDSARTRQKQAMALIEPIAILLIGAVIGVLMVSVMMAISSMSSGAV